MQSRGGEVRPAVRWMAIAAVLATVALSVYSMLPH